jgi:DNA polymerase III sliding clamp (beta) subunit (PCNA family)
MKPAPLQAENVVDDQGRQLGLSATVVRSELLEKLELATILKPMLRVIFGALLETSADCLRITADNFETRCVVEVPTTVEREGSVVCSPHRLLTVLDNADADEVTINSTDAKSVEVTCGGRAATLACGPVSDFPQRPVEPVQATFEVPNLRAVLTWLSPAVNDDAPHQGIHFIGDGQTLRIEAVDGRQLHCVAIESPVVVNVIAPPVLIKFIKVFDADAGCTVEVTARTISLRTEKVLIRAQLLEDRFPDTAHVIPERSDKVFTLPKSALENALEGAGAVLERNVGPCHLDVSVTPTVTTIRTPRCVAGSVETVIETPNPFPIDFQIAPARLLAATKHVDADVVAIQCDDPSRSACIRSGDFLAVIALMRIES